MCVRIHVCGQYVMCACHLQNYVLCMQVGILLLEFRYNLSLCVHFCFDCVLDKINMLTACACYTNLLQNAQYM